MLNFNRYQIIDSHTGETLPYKYITRRHAQRKVDKLDLEYGAVRYLVIRILTDEDREILKSHQPS